MIAIITSCINPIKFSNLTRSYFSIDERIEQTIHTLNKLEEKGFEKIFLVDNSDCFDFSNIQRQFPKLQILHFKQYQFTNKSINEVLLLLAALSVIPDNTTIFKISGRYFPSDDFKITFNQEVDFMIKGSNFHSRNATISTRGYFVKNKLVFEDFLVAALNEIYTYQLRIVGFRSLMLAVKHLFNPSLRHIPSISIEFAAARVLKIGKYKYELLENIHIRGNIAGLPNKQFIIE